LIYVLGDVTTPVKHLFGPKAVSVRDTANIADKLAVDPETSFIDTLIVPSNILNGIGGKVLKQSFHTKHPKVAVIIFYKNVDDRDSFEDIEDLPNVFIHQYQKINDVAFFQECIEQDLEKAVLAGEINLPQSGAEVVSPIGEPVDIFKRGDHSGAPTHSEQPAWVSSTPDSSPGVPTFSTSNFGAQESFASPSPVVGATPVRQVRYEFEPGGVIDPEKAAITTVDTWSEAATPMASPMGYVPAPAIELSNYGRPSQSLSERLQKAAENLNVEHIDQLLQNGTIARELMSENADYMGAQTAISILDKQINAVYTDPKLTNSQDRMQKIIALCAQRSSHKAVTNSLFAQKCQELITTISQSALDCVDELRDEYKVKYTPLDVANLFYQNREKLEQISTERLNGQLDLTDTLSRLRRLYLILDKTKDEAVQTISSPEISRNSLVNTSLRPMAEMFTPVNTTELVRAMLNAMEANRVTFAQAETDLTELFDNLFKVADLSDAYVVQSAKQLQLLEANRVEDLIICENTIKYKIHSMIGPNNVGKTATAVCVATARARTDNVLLIDLSHDSHLDRYVRSTTTLADFYEAQTKDRLKIVKRSATCIFNEYKFEEALKGACPHYRYIYVLMSLDNDEEYAFLKKISLSVNFITNATIDKIDELREMTASFDEENTARLVTLINCEADPLDVLEALGVDQIMTRLIRIPFFKEIQSATLRRVNPCDSAFVADFFIEAFS